VLRSQQAGENRAAPPLALALGRAIEVALIRLRTHWFAGERSNHGGVGRSGRRLLSLAVSAKLRQKDLARRIFCQMRRPIERGSRAVDCAYCLNFAGEPLS
jgi:hypothetical protein